MKLRFNNTEKQSNQLMVELLKHSPNFDSLILVCGKTQSTNKTILRFSQPEI